MFERIREWQGGMVRGVTKHLEVSAGAVAWCAARCCALVGTVPQGCQHSAGYTCPRLFLLVQGMAQLLPPHMTVRRVLTWVEDAERLHADWAQGAKSWEER